MQVVAVILFYKTRILAFKRGFSKNKFISFKYEFPGGKVRKEEIFEIALRREIREELNLELGRLFFVFKNDFRYSNILVNLRFYITKINNLNFSLNEHLEFKILDLKDLRSVDWLEADYPVIKYLEKNSRKLYKLFN